MVIYHNKYTNSNDDPQSKSRRFSGAFSGVHFFFSSRAFSGILEAGINCTREDIDNEKTHNYLLFRLSHPYCVCHDVCLCCNSGDESVGVQLKLYCKSGEDFGCEHRENEKEVIKEVPVPLHDRE